MLGFRYFQGISRKIDFSNFLIILKVNVIVTKADALNSSHIKDITLELNASFSEAGKNSFA